MNKPLVYLAGSLRNEAIPAIHQELSAKLPELTFFSDWYAAGPTADDTWKSYEQGLGYGYEEALRRPSAINVFEFDKRWIDASWAMVLILPAGRSGHLELGYALGRGKLGFILLEDGADPRWDVMYQFATGVHSSLVGLADDLLQRIPLVPKCDKVCQNV